MRIVFMGTPEFSVPVLDALVNTGHEIAAVYCQPPRPAGRGKKLLTSPVHDRAEALRLDVLTPRSLKSEEDQRAFAAHRADIAVVAAYGLILPEAILASPREGCINVHASLLPRWRGAAPIQRSILAGDAETGVAIMQMEAGLDTGPVRLIERRPIAGESAGELTHELSMMGARMMVTVLADLAGHPAKPQRNEGVTYAAKITKSEARLDFNQDSQSVLRQVQAFNPPGAWFEVNGERVRVLEASAVDTSGSPGMVIDNKLTIACRAGAVRPVKVQRAGRGVIHTDELLRGFAIPAGRTL